MKLDRMLLCVPRPFYFCILPIFGVIRLAGKAPKHSDTKMVMVWIRMVPTGS